jgi:hypothetical protein
MGSGTTARLGFYLELLKGVVGEAGRVVLGRDGNFGLGGRRMRLVIFWRGGMGARFTVLARVFGALVPGERSDHDDDVAAIELGFEVGLPIRRDLGDKFFNDIKTDFRVGHFAATEFEGDFDFHVFAQEINGMHELDAQVMGINARAELDFLDGGGVLVFARFFFLLGQFVAELADLHQAAHGRVGRGRNFHEVNAMLAGDHEGIVQEEDAEIFVVSINDADFAGADFAVDPEVRGGGGIT